ncbi:MAG: radical SAM protein [Elusimicrobia bacterium]|nr:radical SAM protein [Elusimicrobiota bacterium]
MALSRREFIKKGLIVAGTAAAAPSLFAGTVLDRQNTQTSNTTAYVPRYIELERSGELARREKALWDLYSPCVLCPRLCKTNRAAGQGGACTVASNFRVSSFGPDFGNEPPIRGTRGSGSIFLSNCNLLCIFCQNWQINHRGDGRVTTPGELARMLLDMQNMGCHNVSFITPTHLVPHLIQGLRIAIAGGLNVPLCYNTGGYESLEVIKLLDGIVDIYQPDFKFQDSAIAARFTQGAPDYALHAAAAIKEMHRQVGNLHIVNGLAQHGVVIRHLVLPENLGGADLLVRWIVDNFGTDTHVNIMGQYWPAFRANNFPPLDRRLTRAEYNQALTWARQAGLYNFH